MAMAPPVFNADGAVEIYYVNGSVCDDDPSLNYRTKITFKCKPGAFPGEPVLGKSSSSYILYPGVNVKILKKVSPKIVEKSAILSQTTAIWAEKI
jgi:hypothetical protein